jgi:energy-coupling factor transporter ATP-binding protein EcfA2
MVPDGDSKAGVEELVLDRLGSSGLSGRAEDLVTAALLGDDELSAVLSADGEPGSRLKPAVTLPSTVPADVFLQSVIVEGFRGIGPQAALRVQPGPGLTLVAGRNGSGKSSFAEAAELVMTGDNKRWSGRTAVWRAGWRNLHAGGGPSRICIELAVDGQPGVTKVTREWPPGADLDGAATFAQRQGHPREPLPDLGWSRPLELYRPFLSYSELGTLLGGRPSEMYDALQAILGLDVLIDAERRLNEVRKKAETASRQAKLALPALLDQLARHSDERARRAETALGRRPPDLAAVEVLAGGGQDLDDEVTGRLRQVTAITLPSGQAADDAVATLAAAGGQVAGLAGTAAADARRLCVLLSSALDHHADHPGQPCPVCGGRVLDAAWAGDARAEITRLTAAAQDADRVHAELRTADRVLRTMIIAQPPVLNEGVDLGDDVDGGQARAAWLAWQDLAANAPAAQLISDAGDRFGALAAAVDRLRADAGQVLQRRSEAWQPVATALAAWVELASTSHRAEAMVADVRKAIAWLREIGHDIRNARIVPFAEKSAMVWDLLRQESNVELGPIRLEGAATQRRVALDVTVDGIGGAALSVMSQGELHALALALFLPRATAADSPFRFVVIDDPVQSMDPAKVDGLARLLARVAEDRQVIVFTHDDRLPEAVRRLQLPAAIWEVTRRERSVVELKKNDDPVLRYLDDARAIALSGELPEKVRAVVVAGYCRSALEAACHQAIRTRRFKAGMRHADVERALDDAQTLHDVVALALFDDTRQGGQVVTRLRQLRGQAAVNAFKAAKSGTHAAYEGDLMSLVKDTGRLAEALRA